MAMFESLSNRLQDTFEGLRGKGKLNEADIDAAMREVRMALLEADVNFKVVKEFVAKCKARCLTSEVLESLSPAQNVVKIVLDELTELLGSTESRLVLTSRIPNVIMLVGLQGSGKTTAAAKLALLLKSQGHAPLLAACDVYRPAAADQLETLGGELGVKVYRGDGKHPVDIAKGAIRAAIDDMKDVVIVDTAGRLQIDEGLMEELRRINHEIHPEEGLLLVDAAAGQDAVNVANAFNKELHLTGVIMSRLDGDARGGAALSIKYLTGLPIKFAGVGEKITDMEIFYPDRMADRILGMGDVVTLVEKAKEQIDEKQAEKDARKMLDGNFTLEDMLRQMKQVQKLGSMKAIAKLIPGMPKISDEQQAQAEKEMKTFEAIIDSMTPYERKHPEILRYSHKNRIAKGSGKTNADINRVLRKYEQSKEMMKQMKQYQKSGKMPRGGNMPWGR